MEVNINKGLNEIFWNKLRKEASYFRLKKRQFTPLMRVMKIVQAVQFKYAEFRRIPDAVFVRLRWRCMNEPICQDTYNLRRPTPPRYKFDLLD